MADDPHVATWTGLLDGDPFLTYYTEDIPEDAPNAYLKLYFGRHDQVGDNLNGYSDLAVSRAYCHCVADTAQGARIIAGRVRGKFLDARVTVDGRVAYLVRQESSFPPVRDQTTGSSVYDQTDTYVLRSVS